MRLGAPSRFASLLVGTDSSGLCIVDHPIRQLHQRKPRSGCKRICGRLHRPKGLCGLVQHFGSSLTFRIWGQLEALTQAEEEDIDLGREAVPRKLERNRYLKDLLN